MASTSFREILQDIVNLSTEDKVKMAAQSYAKILPVLAQITPDSGGGELVCAIIGATVGADGVITNEERALVSAIFKVHGVDMSDDVITLLVAKHSTDDWRALISKLAGALTGDDHTNLIMFVAAICAIDNTISREESAFLASLLYQ